MLYCPNCKINLSEDSIFCEKCGCRAVDRIESKCTQCGKTVSDDSLFCEYCGAVICSDISSNNQRASSELKGDKLMRENEKPSRDAGHQTGGSKLKAALGGMGALLIITLLFGVMWYSKMEEYKTLNESQKQVIEELKADSESLRASVSKLEEENSELKDTISAIESADKEKDDKITELNSEITLLSEISEKYTRMCSRVYKGFASRNFYVIYPIVIVQKNNNVNIPVHATYKTTYNANYSESEVSLQWAGTIEDDTLHLRVIGLECGMSTITLTNNLNKEKAEILVIVKE